MKHTITIEKSDIKTSLKGINICIASSENFNIVFTPDALEDLIVDYSEIKMMMDSEKNRIIQEVRQDPNQLEIPFES